MIAPDKIIYLDNNATTQIDPAVLEEMLPFLRDYYGNPSSGYRFGKQVREAIELARERVAALLGCLASEVIFTSGGTESNNAALNSALEIDPTRRHVVTTAVEHSAIRRHCEQLTQRGCEVTAVGVDADGNLDLDELYDAVLPQTAIVSAMWANNETGVLFPVEKIAALVQEKRALFHTDAVQAIGKIPVRLADSAIHFLSLSAHKLHGPKGVGALYVNRRCAFRPTILGGSQENARRAGTENAASIVGFGKAAEIAREKLEEEGRCVRALRDRFEEAVQAAVPDCFVNGAGAMRLPNTSNLSFAGLESEAVLLLLDQKGICCSAGSACRTGSVESSHVLRAMNLSEDRLRGSARFSFGRFNTEEEVDRVIPLMAGVITRLRELAPKASVAGAPR